MEALASKTEIHIKNLLACIDIKVNTNFSEIYTGNMFTGKPLPFWNMLTCEHVDEFGGGVSTREVTGGPSCMS